MEVPLLRRLELDPDALLPQVQGKRVRVSADPPGWEEARVALCKRYGMPPDSNFERLIEAMGFEPDVIDNDSYPPEEEYEL